MVTKKLVCPVTDSEHKKFSIVAMNSGTTKQGLLKAVVKDFLKLKKNYRIHVAKTLTK